MGPGLTWGLETARNKRALRCESGRKSSQKEKKTYWAVERTKKKHTLRSAVGTPKKAARASTHD